MPNFKCIFVHMLFSYTPRRDFALKVLSCCDMFSVDNMYHHKYKVTSFVRLPKVAARDLSIHAFRSIIRLDIICESSAGRRLT